MEAHKETRKPDEKGQPIPVNNLRDTVHKGLFLPIQIGDQYITALIDTGSNITILKKSIYEEWRDNKPQIAKTGDRAKFHGQINTRVYYWQTTVSIFSFPSRHFQ
ncbi:hypothetical protein DPMN_161487 [Dreissena polymorpha]|uniref:Peptidase A2 domain-containing protein n=1 Tax=Dreissena polymorpha TaxID=45954 RepID=A0A9D4ISQ9_DREPO|nr:hypothetical protein DPMN_161487 [Dreissena polymorpha]